MDEFEFDPPRPKVRSEKFYADFRAEKIAAGGSPEIVDAVIEEMRQFDIILNADYKTVH